MSIGDWSGWWRGCEHDFSPLTNRCTRCGDMLARAHARPPRPITREDFYHALVGSGVSPEMAARVVAKDQSTEDPGCQYGYKPDWAEVL